MNNIQRNEGKNLVDTYVHVIAGLTIFSRIADVATTFLVTPTLKFEANLLVRRFGWKYALLTILIGFIPYLSVEAGVIILTASFMVAASNAAKIVMARALGEKEMAALSYRIISVTRPWPGLLFLLLPAFFIALLGCIMLFFYPQGSEWGYYFAMGMLSYALAMLIWYPIGYFRVRAKIKKLSNEALTVGRN